MFRLQFALAWRNVIKRKLYSLIEVGGLMAGVACFVMIALHVKNEFSYDRGFKDHETIYRVLNFEEGSGNRYSGGSSSLGFHASSEIPQVEEVVRVFFPYRMFSTSALVRVDDNQFYEDNIIEADSNFFNLFNFHFTEGNSGTALKEPANVVIHERVAEKFFGRESAIGKTLIIENEQVVVTGVVRAPGNTHLDFDFLRPAHRTPAQLYNWDQTLAFTYVRIKSEDIATVQDQLYMIIMKHASANNADYLKGYKHRLQALADIHTDPIQWDIVTAVSPTQLWSLTGIAVFILLLAIVNFVNLTTARASERMKESGISKILGASKRRLTMQFFLESFILCSVAVLLSTIALYAAIPMLQEFVTINLQPSDLFASELLVGLILLTFIVAILSGLYPAIQISSVQPRDVIKRVSTSGGSTVAFRNALVVFQFVISISLLTSTFIIQDQIRYMQEADLGFNKENIFIVRLRREDRVKFDELKQTLLKESEVAGIGGASALIGGEPGSETFHPDHMPDPTPETFSSNIAVDPDFFQVMGVPLIAGRNFQKESPADYRNAFILNEAAVKRFTLTDPVGANFRRSGDPRGTVIGVMKDFHFSRMDNQIGPMVFFMDSIRSHGYMFVRLEGNPVTAVSKVEKAWAGIFPDKPMEGFFQDQFLNGLYKQERQVSILTKLFTALAIVLACLGLLGMSSFNVLRRTREVGIRKVIGASSADIVILLSSPFFKLIGVAFFISIPITIFLMSEWLDNFVRHISIEWTLFAVTGLITVVVSFATLSFQTIKASVSNPVKALKQE